MATWLTSHDLQRAAPTADALVRKQFAVETKAIDDLARTVTATITTGDVDRDNDTIAPDGWELEEYLRSPVVLWAHDSRQPPIARAISVLRVDNGLQSTAQFPPVGVYPFADMVFSLIKGGFIKATSVGFRALEYTLDDKRGGVNFKRQSLLEWSWVPVPANANALVSAAAEGIALEPLRDWLQASIEAWPGDLRLKGSTWAKLFADAQPEELPTIGKRGRVLSAANEQRLRDALSAITDVLDTLGSGGETPMDDEDDGKTAVSPVTTTGVDLVITPDVLAAMPAHADVVLELAEDEDEALVLADDAPDDLVDVNLSDLRDALGVVVRDAVRALARDATTRTLNALRGRVD